MKISKKWQKRMDWIWTILGAFILIKLGAISILLLHFTDFNQIETNTTSAILGMSAFFGMLFFMLFFISYPKWWRDDQR